MGYGWCLQQSGKTEEAIAQYRKTIEMGWEKEKDRRSAGPGWHSVVAEASGYLTPFLDPVKDREELATLKERVAMSRMPRAITPIAVPLSDGLEAADLTDLLQKRYSIHVRPRFVEGEWEGIRVTPNVFSTLEEVDTFARGIRELATA